MMLASRLAAGFLGGTIAAFLLAAAVLRVLPAAPRDSMSAAGMLLMLAWPTLVVAAFVPERPSRGWLIIGITATVALLVGWLPS